MPKTFKSEISYRFQKDDILNQVRGDINDINSWKLAFPEINFDDFDNTDLYWEEFSTTEIAAFVAIMQATELASISYCLELSPIEGDDNLINREINDIYKIFNLWLAHLFKYFEENSIILSEELVELLLKNINDTSNFITLESLDFAHKKIV